MASAAITELQSVVERFVAAAGEPAVLDPGEEPLRLIPGQWMLSEWSGRVVLEAWNGPRNLVRKICGVNGQSRDRITLAIERFPKLTGELQIADLSAPSGRELTRRASRTAFRERFQLMLAREYPDWRMEELSIEPNLEQSLSPSYARAFLRSGVNGIAAIAAPPDAQDCPAIAAFGLIWLEHLRRREDTLTIRQLLLFAPLGREREAAHRVAWIDPAFAACRLFAYDENDRAGAVDVADCGNLDSTLPACRKPPSLHAASPAFGELPDDVACVEQSDGSMLFEVRGLEFARAFQGKLSCGVGRRSRCSPATLTAMAREIARVRAPEAEDRQHPLYSAKPEGWLESQVRVRPDAIDAALRVTPVYGQVPVFSGGERGVIDLLGIDHSGRLAVIELKATADPRLPFQALDYWLRVRRHLTAGDFERLGYFPGVTIRREDPRILLVAPALEFHSTTETTLRALAPSIEFTRIGLAADWRSQLRIMFRLAGSERPQDH